MPSAICWATAWTGPGRPVPSAGSNPPTSARRLGPARSGRVGTRSLAAAMRRRAGGRRRYQAGCAPDDPRTVGMAWRSLLRTRLASKSVLGGEDSMTDAALQLASTIHELVRTHAAASPPPRGLSYLALEHASGTGFHLLDRLSARGIFRKYEFVLELGTELGARSRWLATRLGCDVVATTASQDEAVAAAELTRRARLAAQVRLTVASAGTLPFRAARFTHVWIVEALARVPDP